MVDIALTLKDVTFSYPPGPDIFTGLSVSFGAGREGLVGDNGSGKTTLFYLLMGLKQPSCGQVLLNGQEVNSVVAWRNLRQQVGYLFQDSDDQLFSPTVIEDVAFGPLNYGVEPNEAEDKALTTLTSLGLEKLAFRVTHQLSGGEKKLVALATILVMDPGLLLLDEPTNNLDRLTRLKLINILQDLATPYVIISHDWDFLAETTDQVYNIAHGHLHRCQTAHLHSHPHIHPYGDHPHEHGGV